MSQNAIVAGVQSVIVALRDYQEDFVAKVRARFAAKVKAVLLVAATGSGKTVVFSFIARSAANKGNRVLILAHRDILIKQASRKLTDYGVAHGIIMSGFTPNRMRKVQLASVQTLVRRLKNLPPDAFDLIVIDECHLSAAKSYLDICNHFHPARILGVTGSPIRLDGKGLGRHSGGLFDEIVQGISFRQMIEQAYLARPVVYAAPIKVDLSEVKMRGKDFDSDSLAAVMDKPKITGSAIENWKRICPGVPAAAWCANVAHAQHVADEFNAAGIPAMMLCGESTSEERERATRELENGKLKVVTSAMLLVEGWDCPCVGAVILLRPSMSLSSYLQFVGRGSRLVYAPGMPLDSIEQRFAAIDAGPKGRIFYVLDHAGLTLKHGFADDEREWSLEGEVKGKGKKKEKKELDLAQCPKCHLVHVPAPECPGCGHVYETKPRKLEYAEGNLEEVTPEMRELMKKQRQQTIRNMKTLPELEAYGAKMGYSPNWARHTFGSKQRAREKYQNNF
jgi:superfamily II DNA or RNA helicase